MTGASFYTFHHIHFFHKHSMCSRSLQKTTVMEMKEKLNHSFKMLNYLMTIKNDLC